MVMVCDKFVKVIPRTDVERRLGQSSRSRNNATFSLRDRESCVRRGSAVCVKSLRPLPSD